MSRCSICNNILDNNSEICSKCGTKSELAHSINVPDNNSNKGITKPSIPKLKQLETISEGGESESTIRNIVSTTSAAPVTVQSNNFKPLYTGNKNSYPLDSQETQQEDNSNEEDDVSTSIIKEVYVKPHIGKLPPAFLLESDIDNNTVSGDVISNSDAPDITVNTNEKNLFSVESETPNKESLKLTDPETDNSSIELGPDDLLSSENVLLVDNDNSLVGKARPLSELLELHEEILESHNIESDNNKIINLSTIDDIVENKLESTTDVLNVPNIEQNIDNKENEKKKESINTPSSTGPYILKPLKSITTDNISKKSEEEESQLPLKAAGNTEIIISDDKNILPALSDTELSITESNYLMTDETLDTEVESPALQNNISSPLKPLKPLIAVVASEDINNNRKKNSSTSSQLKPLTSLTSITAAASTVVKNGDSNFSLLKEEMEKEQVNDNKIISSSDEGTFEEISENQNTGYGHDLGDKEVIILNMQQSSTYIDKKTSTNSSCSTETIPLNDDNIVSNCLANESSEDEDIEESINNSEAADTKTIEISPEKFADELEKFESQSTPNEEEMREDIFNTNEDGYYNDTEPDEPIPTSTFPLKKVFYSSLALICVIIILYIYALYFLT